jgi:uncharacterized membrane protein YoaK (UPF0700 family)
MAARTYPAIVPVLLSFVAGYVDSCTFLALFGFFAAQVTGSFVIAGAQLATHEGGVIAKVLAIPAFMLGVAVAVLIVRATEARVWAFRSSLILEALLLAVFLALGLYAGPFDDADNALGVLAGLSTAAAMGVQSALVRLVMRDVPQTNVMTGNSTQFAIDAADLLLGRLGIVSTSADMRRGQRHRIRVVGSMLLAFMLGAATGALAYRLFGLVCMAAAIAIVLGLIVWLMARNWKR